MRGSRELQGWRETSIHLYVVLKELRRGNQSLQVVSKWEGSEKGQNRGQRAWSGFPQLAEESTWTSFQWTRSQAGDVYPPNVSPIQLFFSIHTAIPKFTIAPSPELHTASAILPTLHDYVGTIPHNTQGQIVPPPSTVACHASLTSATLGCLGHLWLGSMFRGKPSVCVEFLSFLSHIVRL